MAAGMETAREDENVCGWGGVGGCLLCKFVRIFFGDGSGAAHIHGHILS